MEGLFTNISEENVSENTKTCSRCRKVLPISEFPYKRDKSRPVDKRRSHCRTCKNKESSEWNKRTTKKRGEARKAKYVSNAAFRANSLVKSCKSRAKIKNVPFSLDPNTIVSAVESGACQVTGIEFVLEDTGNSGLGYSPWAPSIDRIVPSKGYTPENTRVVVLAFNIAKQSLSDKELLALANAIIDNADNLNMDIAS